MSRSPVLPVLRVGVVLVIAAALLLHRPYSSPGEPPPEPGVVWATDIDGQSWPTRLGERATGPLEGQKRPPCAPRREREVAGACWIQTVHVPPCPEGLFEAPGLCLVPVLAAKRPPTSLHR